MHAQRHEPPSHQQQIPTTPATQRPARYGVGPSKGRPHADTCAPGVAQAPGHQGAPEQDKDEPAVDTEPPSPSAAAEEAALRRVARRRARENVQRKDRVDVRYSIEEKNRIVARARKMEIAGAHLVGAVIMSYLDGNLALAGQRTQLDDYIDALNALREQVARIGRNVNQIAKNLNSGGDPHPSDTALLAHTDRTLHAVGATVRDIATAANQALSSKAAR